MIKQNQIDQIEDFIEKNYDIRYNTISNEFEYRIKAENKKNPNYNEEDEIKYTFKERSFSEWENLNESNILRQLLKQYYKCDINKLRIILKSDFIMKYNPFYNYFESLPKWNQEIDYIDKLTSYIHIKDEDKERFKTQFKKMFVRTIACGLEITLNKQAFIIVHEKQNSGKTTFFRWLVPPDLKDYYAENISTDKDSRIALTNNIIINLDELSTLSKKDINDLKSFMSKDRFKDRLPYDARPVNLQRRASFVGSTNNSEFLTDATGNVRWLCFEINSIDWKYKTDIDINNIWMQAYHLFKNDFNYQLSKSEIDENEEANKKFLIKTPEIELLQMFYKDSDKDDVEAKFLTTTDLLNELSKKVTMSVKLNTNNVGKALKILGFKQQSKYDVDKNFTIKGYFIVEKNREITTHEDLIPIQEPDPNSETFWEDMKKYNEQKDKLKNINKN